MTTPDHFENLINRARQQVEDVAHTPADDSGAPATLHGGGAPSDFLPGYELVRELARGGQGVVYLARQQGTKRLVAVKMVREGPFSRPAERARFEREVEILGSLRHPHIVTIHDSGIAAGCSYFVMDYIAGATLDAVVDERRQSADAPSSAFIRDTLALFAEVCTAVHAAHLRGVIHRDLKPGNIRLNEDGHPLVLDFGLAKPFTADGSSAGATLTETGQFIGTVNYASPEQIESDGHTLDLRSDIYALGVILYELLTDHWPYDVPETATLRQRFDAILHEPARRPRALVPDLDDDVETILLKCLDKQPERRYQSAGALASDIHHVLAGEPIVAKRDSALYVLRKNLKRHRAAVAVAGLFVAVLLVATIVMTVMYDRERQARDVAQRHYEQVRTLAHKLIFDMDDQIRPLVGSTAARKMLVQTGLQHLDELARDTAEEDEDTAWILATAYMKTGDVQGGLGIHNLGDSTGARISYDKALEIADRMYARHPADPRWIDCQANARLRRGNMSLKKGHIDAAEENYATALQLAEALPDDVVRYRRLLTICLTRLGNVQVRSGHNPDALQSYNRALDISLALVDEDPADYKSRVDVAVHEYKIGRVKAIQGNPQEALKRYRTALTLRRGLLDQHPDSAEQRYACAELLIDIADILANQNQLDEALAHYREALDTDTSLAMAEPGNPRISGELALIHERIAGVLLAQDLTSDARSHYEQSLSLRADVVERDPSNAIAQRELAVAYEKVGNMLNDQGRTDDALERFGLSLAIRERILSNSPSSAEAQRDVAVAHFKLAAAHGTAGANDSLTPADRLERWGMARGCYERSLAIMEQMRENDTLASSDAGIPDLLTQRITECNAQIQALSDHNLNTEE